jgi:hypothetical protein
MTKKIFLALLFVFFLSHTVFSASKLEITSPRDGTRTYSIRAIINGAAGGAKALSINGTKVETGKSGKFSAVALLKSGKNLIRITAAYSDGTTLTKNIRILRIVTYDDIEQLYKGRSHWAKNDILALSTIGIIEGYPNNIFETGKPITRGELATWIARSKSLPETKPKEDVFFDVPKEHWRAPYIKAVVDAGYMRGVSGDRFGIEDTIKRDEAMEVITKAYDVKIASFPSNMPFMDVTTGTEYANFIISAYNSGLVKGVLGKDKLFEPERDIKRGEVALIISRTTYVKKLKAVLFDYDIGYTSDRYSSISTSPIIRKISAIPGKVPADGKTPLTLSAEIFDAQGKNDISQVWIDLSVIGGPNNAKMNLGRNGSYELSFVLTTETTSGDKILTIGALDKSGLKTTGNVKFTVTGNK